MEIEEYHVEVKRTSSPDAPHNEVIVLAGLGIAGEAAEVVSLVRETATDEDFTGIQSIHQRDDLREEAGDLLWYMAYLLNHFNLTFDVITASSLDSYQSFFADHPRDITVTALDMSIAAGALADIAKKHVLHQKPLDMISLVGQLVLVFANLTILLNHFDIKLTDALDTNTAKLRIRYPNGWSAIDSLARADKQQQKA